MLTAAELKEIEELEASEEEAIGKAQHKEGGENK